MPSNSIAFSQPMFVVITGASQGIGQCLAIELAKKIPTTSTIALIARSQEGLDETRTHILAVNGGLSVRIVPLDLTHPELDDLQKVFEPLPHFHTALIVHNVGQIGALLKATDLTDRSKWRDYYDLNVFSVALLNSVFMRNCRDKGRVCVVNVTSLVGRQPFRNLAMYGTGKAARELYFRVLALEEAGVCVLNYSPGPVNTRMVEEIIDNATDEEMKAMFVDMREQGTILTPTQTVGKLLEILEKGDYKSGDVIDYFDRA